MEAQSKSRPVSSYDPTCATRTRLEDEDGTVLASFGCFRGDLWYHSEELGAFKMKQVVEDPTDQLLGTAMLIRAGNEIFAFAGFLKGGSDLFNAWKIDECTSEIFPPARESRLRAFGAAFVNESLVNSVKGYIACGIGLKTVRLFSLEKSLVEESYGFTYKGTINCKGAVSALSFDVSGKKLVAISGGDGETEFHVWHFPDKITEEEKYKFTNLGTSVGRLNEVLGCPKLLASLSARDHAFRNPRSRNDDMENWFSVFPELNISSTIQLLDDDMSVKSSESCVSVSSGSQPGFSRRRKQPSNGETGRGSRRAAGKQPRLQPRQGGAQEPIITGSVAEELLQAVHQCVSMQKKLDEKLDSIQGTLSILKSEQGRVIHHLMNTQSSDAGSPVVAPVASGSLVSPLFGTVDASLGGFGQVDFGAYDALIPTPSQLRLSASSAPPSATQSPVGPPVCET